MCFKYCYDKKTPFTDKTHYLNLEQKYYRQIICSSCHNKCYTNYLYINYLGTKGFCNYCWDKLMNFALE